MRINNKYLIWWDNTTKVVQNDYTEEVDPNAVYDFAVNVSFFAADTLDAIEEKITELELIIEVKDDEDLVI